MCAFYKPPKHIRHIDDEIFNPDCFTGKEEDDEVTLFDFLSGPVADEGLTFVKSDGKLHTNPNYVFDDDNTRLGIGTNSPDTTLHVEGNSTLDGTVGISNNLTVSGTASTGALTASSITTTGAASTGELSSSSLNVAGASTLTGTVGISNNLTVSGTATTGALTASSITTTGTASTGALTASSISTAGTASTGALTASSITTAGTASTGALTASSINVAGTSTLTGDVGVTNNLTVGETLTTKNITINGTFGTEKASFKSSNFNVLVSSGPIANCSKTDEYPVVIQSLDNTNNLTKSAIAFSANSNTSAVPEITLDYTRTADGPARGKLDINVCGQTNKDTVASFQNNKIVLNKEVHISPDVGGNKIILYQDPITNTKHVKMFASENGLSFTTVNGEFTVTNTSDSSTPLTVNSYRLLVNNIFSSRNLISRPDLPVLITEGSTPSLTTEYPLMITSSGTPQENTVRAAIGFSDGTTQFATAPAASISYITRNATNKTGDLQFEFLTATTRQKAVTFGPNIQSFWKPVKINGDASNGYLSIFLHCVTDSTLKGTASWGTTSDQRLKENIVEADYDMCYNNIKSLSLKRFRWKDQYMTDDNIGGDRNILGWIAQEVETIYPKAVKTTKMNDEIPDLKTLQVDQIHATMYGALKRLIQKVESLEAEITLLKSNP